MSHEITIRENGIAEAVYAKEPAWHGLGQLLPEGLNSEEAFKHAHLDWPVVPRPLYTRLQANGLPVLLEDYVLNVRMDNNFPLGVVSTGYQIVQNAKAFEFLDSLVMDGILKYESAFSLAGGKRIALLARMPQVDVVAQGDKLARYLLFSNSHDGSGSVRVMPTSVRVVCANTLALALQSGKANDGVSIRHTGRMDDKLQIARRVILSTEKAFERFATVADRLSQVPVMKSKFEKYLDVVAPLPERGVNGVSVRKNERAAEARCEIIALYHKEPRTMANGAGGTWWGAVNGVTAWVDHHQNRRGADLHARAESRFNVTQFGSGAALKTKALVTAVELSRISVD